MFILLPTPEHEIDLVSCELTHQDTWTVQTAVMEIVVGPMPVSGRST